MIALGFARMADAVANSFLVVVLPLYIASTHVTGTALGLSDSAITGVILAAFGIFNALMQPFAGRMSDRAGKRKLFVLGGLIALAGFNALYGFAASYLALLAIRIGQGLCVAFTITATVALVNEISTRENRGANMGVYNSLRLVGFGVGPLAAGFVVSSGPYDVLGMRFTGFDGAFAIATVGALVGAVLVLVLVHDPESTTATPRRVEISVRSAEPGHVLDPLFTLGLATLVMAGCIALLASIEPHVNAHLHQGPRWFGIQFAVFILSLAVAQPFIGKLSDRWGRRGFIIVGLMLLAPTTLAQGLVGSSWGMLGARLAQGLAGAMVFAPALALGGDLAAAGQSGLQLAILTMSFGLGLSAGQLAAGFLVGLGYIVPFAIGAGLALVAALVVRAEVVAPPKAETGPENGG